MSDMRAVLRLHMGEERAGRAAQALRPDDDALVSTRAEAGFLIVEVRAKQLRSLVRALDDVLLNLAVSEGVLRSGPFDND